MKVDGNVGQMLNREKAKCRAPGLSAEHVTILPRSGLAYWAPKGPFMRFFLIIIAVKDL